MRLIFFCLIACIFVPVVSVGQEKNAVKILKEILKDYDKLKTLSGKMDIYLGSPAPGSDMVGHLIGYFHLKKVSQDTTLGWYLATEFHDVDNPVSGYKAYYTGDSLVSFDTEDSTVEKQKGHADGEWGYRSFQESRKLLESYYLRLTLSDSDFQKQENAWLVGDITLGKDTIIGGRECFFIENHKEGGIPDRKVKINNVERIAIDKAYNYPVCYYRHFKRKVDDVPNIDQRLWKITSEIRVNKPIPDSVFVLNEEVKEKIEKKVNQLTVGTKAPNWRLPSVTEDTVELYQQRGKCFIIEFGYIGCGACALATAALKREVLDSCEDIRLFYINPLDSFKKLQEYAREMDDSCEILKGDSLVIEQYGVGESYPRIFILDQDFVIRIVVPGYWEDMGKMVRQRIEELIK